MKRVMLVAHPDDETLWGAGIIMRYPGDWTVICASIPQIDPIRAQKFKDACEVLGAFPVVIDKIEDMANEPMKGLEDIDLSEYDHIVTHGEWGEYGHLHHKNVHRYVARKYGKKILTFFGYRPKGEGKHKIELTEFEVARKLRALKCYNHVLPYNGKPMPKWEALYERYITEGGISFDVETYDGALP